VLLLDSCPFTRLITVRDQLLNIYLCADTGEAVIVRNFSGMYKAVSG
jgi:hypothetical protein